MEYKRSNAASHALTPLSLRTFVAPVTPVAFLPRLTCCYMLLLLLSQSHFGPLRHLQMLQLCQIAMFRDLRSLFPRPLPCV